MSAWGVACCPRCGDPLVSTMAWDRFEFYCLSCGGHFGFLEPDGKPETADLLALTEARREEFRELANGALIPDHQRHIHDQDELDAHDAAVARLAARAMSGA